MTKKQAIAKVREDYSNLRDLKKYHNDRDVVMAAVETDGWALQYATEELKADKEIVTVAVKRFSESLYFASEKLKSDKRLLKLYIIGVMKKHYKSLELAIEHDEFDGFELDLVRDVYKKMDKE